MEFNSIILQLLRDSNLIQNLTELASKYGPEFFAVLFCLFVLQWSYTIYKDAINRKPRVKKDVELHRNVFIGCCIITVLLIGGSIFNFYRKPETIPFYVYRGQILDVQDTEFIEPANSDDIYFRDDPIPGPNGTPSKYRNIRFLVYSKSPFEEKKKFRLNFFKTGATEADKRELDLEFVKNEPCEFKLYYDENVFPPKYKFRNLQIDSGTLNPENVTKNILKPKPNYITNVSFELIPNNFYLLEYTNYIINLQDERVNITTKIQLLEELNKLQHEELLKIIKVNTKEEPMITTILDLTRHDDKEIAYWAKAIDKKIQFNDLMIQMLESDDKFWPLFEKILFRMEKERARSILNNSANEVSQLNNSNRLEKFLLELKKKLESNKYTRVLYPVGSQYGDQYYVKAIYDRNNTMQLNCLASIFYNELMNPKKSLEEEKTFMMNKNVRFIYWYSKDWVLNIYSKISSCDGVIAEFVPGSQLKGNGR